MFECALLLIGRDALPHTKGETTDNIDQKESPVLSEENAGAEEKHLAIADEEIIKKSVTKRDDQKKDDTRKHTRSELVAILAYLELKKRLRSEMQSKTDDQQYSYVD